MIKLLYKFIEITLRHGCSLVNLLHIIFARNCKFGAKCWLCLNEKFEIIDYANQEETFFCLFFLCGHSGPSRSESAAGKPGRNKNDHNCLENVAMLASIYFQQESSKDYKSNDTHLVTSQENIVNL